MTNQQISVKDSNGASKLMLAQNNQDGSVSFYHVEDDTQRSALLSMLDTLAKASAQATGNTTLTSIASNTTGLATATAQTTGNTALATIASNTTALATSLGQTTGNNSLATIATNTTGVATAAGQSTGNTSLSTIVTNTSGLATASAQTSGNSSLSTIATNTGNLSTLVTNTTGLATASGQTATQTSLGSLTETAPISDTASSGVNGRLQRLAQRLTNLISLFPTSIGQKAKTGSLSVTLSSDDDLLTKIGEVQASPTANTVLDRLKSISTALSGGLTASIGASENHLGKIGGETKVATDSPVLTASSAYTSGNLLGGKLTFAGLGRIAGGTGLIQMGLVSAKTTQSFAVDLILFHTDPTGTTFTDKAAFSLAAADYDKVLGKISFLATDWTVLGTPSFAQQVALAMAYKVATGATDLYGALVVRGTPTFASTSDLKVTLKGLLD